MKKRVIAALVATSALIFAWGNAWAVAYNMVGWFQRSSGGTLSALMFRAGTSQGCPNYPASAPTTNIQPCYNPSPANTNVKAWQDTYTANPVADGTPSDGGNGTYTGANPAGATGIITAIINAGLATWDWDTGTDTLTGSGLFWSTSSINSNPNATQVLSDIVEDLVIDAASDTTSGSFYGCLEGIFLVTVGTSGCQTVDLVNPNQNSTGSVIYNIGSDPSCVARTVGAGETVTGPTRGFYDRAAGGGCDDTVGQSAFMQHAIVLDDGDVLILARLPHDEVQDPDVNDAADTAALFWPYNDPTDLPTTCPAGGAHGAPYKCWPAITVTDIGRCPIWGPQLIGTNSYAAGGTFTPTGIAYTSAAVAACPPDILVRSGSWLVLYRPGAADTDGDTVPNGVDNCINVSNPDQFDGDGDGFGNNCDADLNQSGLTTATDYTILRTYLNTTRIIPDLSRGTNPPTGLVTATDYTILRNRLNTVPGPSGNRPRGGPPCSTSGTCSGPNTPGYHGVGATPTANVY